MIINIENAVWVIENEKTKKSQTYTTNQKGLICLNGLNYGDYRIYEKEVPKNIVRHSNVYKISLNKDNKTADIKVDDPKDEITLIFEIYDYDNIPKKGQKLQIYKNNQEEKVLTTNINGLAPLYNADRNAKYQVKLIDSNDQNLYDANIEEYQNINLTTIKEGSAK